MRWPCTAWSSPSPGIPTWDGGPTQANKAMAVVLEAAMDCGQLRRADPMLAAHQFMALATAEVNMRQFQRKPQPVSLEQIQAMMDRAIDTFFHGFGTRD